MFHTIATALAALGIALGSPGHHAHHQHRAAAMECSTSQVTQTRDVTGQTAAATTYGAPYQQNGHTYRKVTRYTYSGVQSRTVTTTTCGTTTTTTATDWTGAKVVVTTTTERIG